MVKRMRSIPLIISKNSISVVDFKNLKGKKGFIMFKLTRFSNTRELTVEVDFLSF